jgi:hypothetical protein
MPGHPKRPRDHYDFTYFCDELDVSLNWLIMGEGNFLSE